MRAADGLIAEVQKRRERRERWEAAKTWIYAGLIVLACVVTLCLIGAGALQVATWIFG